MSSIVLPSIKERLWHEMRFKLAKFYPDTLNNALLMCPACGRFLPKECFSLEHIIPQQTVKKDPEIVRGNPSTTTNIRSGNILLCTKPLKIKGDTIHNNGCNSWKGRYYDRLISEVLNGKVFGGGKVSDGHIISVIVVAYLAAVSKFGYSVSLARSGVIMRRQFFEPYKFIRDMPVMSQMLLGGDHKPTSPDLPMWSNPFSFSYQGDGECVVTVRGVGVVIPMSHDPEKEFSMHLKIIPAKYKLRPSFETIFD